MFNNKERTLHSQFSILNSPFIILLLLMVSCFKDDEPIPPFVPPEGLIFIEIENDIYENQVFFDFSSETIKKVSENSAWQLGFECGDDGFHVIINSSDFWGIVNTGSTNFQDTEFDLTGKTWQFDSSTGNLDSTAIGDWVDTATGTFSYTNHTYIFGQYDGIKYDPEKKMQFIHFTDSSYTFIASNIDNSDTDTILIRKNNNYNFVHYSFDTKEQLNIEPLKEDWDVVFSQYQTILYTNEGVPTPYFVRGALLNPNNTNAAVDSIMEFYSIEKSDIGTAPLTSRKDIIGHDWKSVSVDEETNSATYKVRENYNYFVVDNENNYFKIQFVSYTNKNGERGFPSFQYYFVE